MDDPKVQAYSVEQLELYLQLDPGEVDETGTAESMVDEPNDSLRIVSASGFMVP